MRSPLLAAALLCSASAFASGKALVVDAAGRGDAKTPLEALGKAKDGDVIRLPSRAPQVGLELWIHGGTATVTGIFRGGPAEGTGLKDGDVVREIDGKPPSAVEVVVGMQLGNGPVGSFCVLTVRRPGEDKDRQVAVQRVGYLPYFIGGDADRGRFAYRQKAYAEAARWLKGPAKKGDARAMLDLARAYERLKDDKNAFEWTRKSAEAGHPDGMWGLGVLYHAGRGVKKDPAAAFEWFKKGSEAGSLKAAVRLGLAYEKGDGTARDDKLAFETLRQAANADDPQGQVELGHLYRLGVGVPRDPAQATSWYMRSAAQENPYGLLNMAWQLYKGEGIARDEKRASAAFSGCASLGLPACQRELGRRLVRGLGGLKKDRKQGFLWLRKAAQAGDRRARELLANGEGAPPAGEPPELEPAVSDDSP